MYLIAESVRDRLCSLGFALVLLAAGSATDAVAAGQICTSADTFMFGNRAVGSSTTANATVTNCGDAPWSFSDVSVHPATGPAFHVSATCATGLTLVPGGKCTVTVTFAPPAAFTTGGATPSYVCTATVVGAAGTDNRPSITYTSGTSITIAVTNTNVNATVGYVCTGN